MALVVDTGPLYGLLDRRDRRHAACRDLLANVVEKVVVPSPVLVELDQLLYSRGRPDVMLTVLDDVANGAYIIADLIHRDYERVRELCAKYADSDIGFVDAAVVAIAERLNEPKIATLDHRHFSLVRPRHVDAFELLPK